MQKSNIIDKIESEFLNRLKIEISQNQAEKFYIFMDELIKKNEVMNLTAITDPDEIILKHFVDSLEIMKTGVIDNHSQNEFSVVDIGTGAGFPGIPLAIMNENIKFLLLDSLQKRINFLEGVISDLGLKNVVVQHMRAEDINLHAVYREKFSLAISRGVTKIRTLSEYLMPYVKISGKIAMYKMSDCDQEFEEGKNAIKILGGKFLEKYEYELKADEPKRCLLLYEKIKKTDPKYPRQGNKPKTQPL